MFQFTAGSKKGWIEKAREDEQSEGPYRLCFETGARFALSALDGIRAQKSGIPYGKPKKGLGLTCYRCAKVIKGQAVRHVPTILAVQLGADFEKAYHPGCYAKDEAEAEKAVKS